MHIDASGRHVWLISQTPIDYIAVQALLSTNLHYVAVLESLDKCFGRLDWPCGGVSYGFPSVSGAESFFCVNKDLEFCIVLAKRFSGGPSKGIAETIASFDKNLRSSVDQIEGALRLGDSDAKLVDASIFAQRSLGDGG
jgi:hypothetical protein